ncbi:hypothetical protein JCM16418A_31960 [Paenibacillus pini]
MNRYQEHLHFAQKTENGLLSYIISSNNVGEDTLLSFPRKIVAEH